MEWDSEGDYFAQEGRAARREARTPTGTPPALMVGLTPDRAELIVALDQLAMLVNCMRACDPEYCAAHDWEPADDQEWDERLGEAEEYLEEMLAKVGVP